MTTKMETREAEAPEQSFLDTLKALNTDRLFVHVELDRLKVDYRYQREVNPRRVKDLAAVYNPDLMGVLVCSVRPDGVYVIDGQHRLEMARLLGHPTIRCELRIGLTLEQEADMFYNLDTKRVPLNSDDAFRALVVAQDERALAITGLIEEAGLRILYGRPAEDNIRCFRTLINSYERYGPDILGRALRVLHDAWPGTINVAPANIVDGMCFFLEKYHDIDTKEVSRALGAHTTTNKLSVEARNIAGSLAWATRISVARAILGAYNHHRSSRKLEDKLG